MIALFDPLRESSALQIFLKAFQARENRASLRGVALWPKIAKFVGELENLRDLRSLFVLLRELFSGDEAEFGLSPMVTLKGLHKGGEVAFLCREVIALAVEDHRVLEDARDHLENLEEGKN